MLMSFPLIYTTMVTCCGLSYPTHLTITLKKFLVYSIKRRSLGQLVHCLLLYVFTHIHFELGWNPEHCTFLLLLIKVDFNNWKQMSWRKETILLVKKMKKKFLTWCREVEGHYGSKGIEERTHVHWQKQVAGPTSKQEVGEQHTQSVWRHFVP